MRMSEEQYESVYTKVKALIKSDDIDETALEISIGMAENAMFNYTKRIRYPTQEQDVTDTMLYGVVLLAVGDYYGLDGKKELVSIREGDRQLNYGSRNIFDKTNRKAYNLLSSVALLYKEQSDE